MTPRARSRSLFLSGLALGWLLALFLIQPEPASAQGDESPAPSEDTQAPSGDTGQSDDAGTASTDESAAEPVLERQSSSIGLELRVYPAGLIPAARLSQDAGDIELLLAVGYNDTDRKDWGEHENEQGGGWGFGGGARVHFSDAGSGWIVGARADLWFMTIDWTDKGEMGSSDVTVLMPTIEGGYQWILGKGHWMLEATLAAGAEININTKGEDVGQGAIGLLGVAAGYRF